MTVLGLALVALGAVVAFTNNLLYNGQWLLGLLIALSGVALCAVHTFTTKENNQ